MTGSFNEAGQLEPGAGTVVVCAGKKGSGKSVMADAYAMNWPYDMVVLDVAGDDGPFPRGKPDSRTHDVIDLTGTVEDLPRQWPEYQRREKRPMILRYVPDPGSPTELEDMDAVMGLALSHSSKAAPVMLVVHEMGRAFPAGRVGPHGRRIVNHNRHHGLNCVFCGPRTMTTEPLLIAQADLVYTFELNQPSDRRRIAENIGWDPGDFDAAVHALGLHEYLLYDARLPKPEQDGDQDERLKHCDPLPAELVDEVQRWVAGDPPKP